MPGSLITVLDMHVMAAHVHDAASGVCDDVCQSQGLEIFGKPMGKQKVKGDGTPSGNRTRVSPVAGEYSTTRPTV